MSLRDYQKHAVRATLAALHEHRGALVVGATGVGKTRIGTTLADLCIKRSGQRVLWLAERGELVRQAAACFESMGHMVAIEKGDDRAHDTPSPVTVASVPSLCDRLDAYAPDAFRLVVVDEAHHAGAATYQRTLAHFTGALRVGLTATPHRLDGKALVPDTFDVQSARYAIEDAITDEWLVRPLVHYVDVEAFDLSTLRTPRRGRDFSREALAKQLDDEAPLHAIASPLPDLLGERRAIIFVPKVRNAHALAEVLTRYGVASEAIDGTMSDEGRAALLDRFRRDKVQAVVSVDVLTEGFDDPGVAAVVNASPSQSWSKVTQRYGRGLRLLGATYEESVAAGKPDCLLIDMTGAADNSRLVCPLDVLTGAPIDEDVRTEARAIAKRKPQARADDVLHEAETAVAEKQRHAVIVDAKVRRKTVDPFVILRASRRAGRWGGQHATEKQIRAIAAGLLSKRECVAFREPLPKVMVALMKHGGVDPAELDRGQATALLDQLAERRRQNLATYPQARWLMRNGLNPDVNRVDAAEAIDAIAANRWRAPAWLYDDPRFAVEAQEGAA